MFNDLGEIMIASSDLFCLVVPFVLLSENINDHILHHYYEQINIIYYLEARKPSYATTKLFFSHCD